MLEGYYAEKDRTERLRTKSKELHKAVHNMYERAVRKQAARQEELAASGKSEKLRLYGELLSANLYLAEKGMKSITVPNWYDEGKEVTIPLDLRFSPSQNAQNFFKNYKKKQTAARMLVEEAITVANACGCTLDHDTELEHAYEVSRMTDETISSMVQDVTHHRETEIRIITGAVCRLGREHGIATPCNDLMLQLVLAKQSIYLGR